MKQIDCFSFKPILSNITRNSHTDEEENLDFSGVFSFHFKACDTKQYIIKHTVNGQYKEVSIKKQEELLHYP